MGKNKHPLILLLLSMQFKDDKISQGQNKSRVNISQELGVFLQYNDKIMYHVGDVAVVFLFLT